MEVPHPMVSSYTTKGDTSEVYRISCIDLLAYYSLGTDSSTVQMGDTGVVLSPSVLSVIGSDTVWHQCMHL